MTPLHIAAANLNLQGVGILLNLGANKRAKANTGSSSKPKMQTPVQIARDWKKLIAKNIGIRPYLEKLFNPQLLKSYESYFSNRYLQSRSGAGH